jgi:GNAT superfamily N-acetyltransferase
VNDYINITTENLQTEHLCCAIGDKKHQAGVDVKKTWLSDRFAEGHVFRKLNAKGKVFIEYAPLEMAWIPVVGDNYFYIYCLWVSGSFKDKGYGKELLEYCISDAKTQNKSGVCAISSKKKKPFTSDKTFMPQYEFEVADSIGNDYELLALSFDGVKPRFTEAAKTQSIDSKDLTVYYSPQCPFTNNCVEQVETHCKENNIPYNIIRIDTLEKAKSIPCVFNNWAVFRYGAFETTTLLNENSLKKVLGE